MTDYVEPHLGYPEQPREEDESIFPSWQAILVSSLTGLLGVAMGMAVFILLVHDPEEMSMRFVVILGVAAALSFAFEYIRNEIEGHEENFTFARVLVMLLML